MREKIKGGIKEEIERRREGQQRKWGNKEEGEEKREGKDITEDE